MPDWPTWSSRSLQQTFQKQLQAPSWSSTWLGSCTPIPLWWDLTTISGTIREGVLNQQGSKQTGYQCYKVFVGDPNKLVPPSGSYAVSYRKGRDVGKGLLIIGGNEILLYPLRGEEQPVAGTCEIYFHKHLVFQGFARLKNEMEAVQELIY